MATAENSFEGKSTSPYHYWAKVEKIVDGDTVDLEVSLGFELAIKIRVRLTSVDAPEIFGVKKVSQEYKAGMKAKRYLESLIPKSKWIEVKIQQNAQREKYGRWLGELYSEGINLNKKMIKSKYAKKLTLLPLLLCGLTSLAARADGEFFNSTHAPGYAQTPWATVHADSSNSDYVPIETSLDLVQSFHVLEGAALWTPPTLGLKRQIYIASGRGPGTSHLHAFSREGALLWESPPQESLDDLDSAALISAPVVDEDGDVYIGDANQFWAFHGDGQRKWVTDFTDLKIEGPFITGMICGEYVGGISADGKVMLLRRADGKLALPVLDLPGGAGPDGPAIPDALWADGLVDPAIRDRTWEILRGHRYEIANSPAVHPQTGRIFIIGSGEGGEGRFYGIDVESDRLRIDFATPVPPGSGTSPAISPDGARLYAMAKGDMFAIDTESGEPLWTLAVNGQDASPSVARDDTVYALGGERLVAVDGGLGRLKWSADYTDFAASRLPEVWTRFGLLTTGKPVAFVDSVVTVTPNQLWTSLLIGYEVNLFGRRFTHAVETYLVALSPVDGAVQRFYPIPDTSEGAITLTRDGDLILDILAAQASIAYYGGYQWLLPAVARAEKPRAGLVGFRPDGRDADLESIE